MAMSPTPSLSVTHITRVTPDQIDELGHMNVRWYGHSARAATVAMCERLGLETPTLLSGYTRHHHEQMEGNDLEVRSAILGGSRRLRFYHELRNRADDDLAATFVHELDHPAVEAPAIELPSYGMPRSIDLDVDRLATAPTLDRLQALNLAIRLERPVTDDDLHPNDLVWGGERPDGETSWIHETPDGDRVASATMESRIWMHEFPTIGTRIQSFVANIEIGDKITHEVGWVFDMERRHPVAAFEGVDLAFSINQRRSVVMPPAVRDREFERYHPDLA
jgi:acyl-CoA thioesterase FadM